MGIKFRCPACDRKLHVKAFLAGKRGVCPKCGAKVWIPLSTEDGATASAGSVEDQSVSHAATHGGASQSPARHGAASAETARHTASSGAPAPSLDLVAAAPGRSAGLDPMSEAPSAVWYVRPPSGGQFGPADATIMRRWLQEGRIGAEALVWREGWSGWNLAREVFPSLDEPAAALAEVPAVASHSPDRNAVVVSEQRGATARRNAAPRSRGLTRSVAVVIALGILCVALGVALFLVLRRAG
jgi:hypothetical protein